MRRFRWRKMGLIPRKHPDSKVWIDWVPLVRRRNRWAVWFVRYGPQPDREDSPLTPADLHEEKHG